MDKELRFIQSLLLSTQGEQQTFYSKRLPFDIFSRREKEMRWIFEFYEKHNVFPSVTAFESRYKVKLDDELTDPCAAVLQAVLDDYQYNQLKGITDVTREMVSNNAEMSKVVSYFRDAATRLNTFNYDSEDIMWGSASTAFARYKERRRLKKSGDYKEMDLPWATANRIIGGEMRPGEVMCIVGRPSLGKTHVAIEIAKHLAVTRKVKVLFYSKEMPTEQIDDRFECNHLGLNPIAFKNSALDMRQFTKWRRYRKSPKDIPLIISGEETIEGTGFDDVYQKVMRHRPMVLFIDGAYLLRPSGLSKGASPNERYQMISQACKRMAKVTKCLVVPVIQQNREAEKTKATKGGLATLYGSDAWAQDADFVIDVQGVRDSNEREIAILKSRDSGVGSFFINFIFDPKIDFSDKSGAASKKEVVEFNVDLKIK